MAGDKTSEPVWGWQSELRTVADRVKHIQREDTFSDVTFRVGPLEGSTVDMKAHKVFLAMGSVVFETMFYGALAETSGIVRITDIDEKTFGILLRYIYHDEMPTFDSSTAFSTLYAAKKYGIPLLKTACEDYLKTSSAEDCLAWFVQAKAYDEEDLAEFLLKKIDLSATSVLKSADFREVSIDVLKEIIGRDTLRVKEGEVLYAVCAGWARRRCAQRKIGYTGPNCRVVLEDALFLIRFPLLEDVHLASVAKSEILLDKEISQLYQFRILNEDLPAKFITRKRITQLAVED